MTSTQNLPIGVFDSGVGGLTVLHGLQQVLPNEHFLYLGDTARLPYGTKSKDTVTRYSQQASAILCHRGIKCLVIACNTASSLALPDLVTHHPDLPIIGVLEPGASAAVKASKTGKIAIIATHSTVKAGSYQRCILALNPNAAVSAHSCPLLVPLAEEGWVDNPITTAIVDYYIAPILKQHNPDTLLLGCTHFPTLLSPIKAVVSDALQIIDSAQTTALQVKQILIQKNLLRKTHANTPTHFLVTDSPHRFHLMAKRFLNDTIDESQVEWVDGVFSQ